MRAPEVETALSPRALLDLCLSIERGLKRIRRQRWGPRTIDIDILLYGQQVIREKGLQIPHPRITERAFVLVPLSQIAPALRIEGISIGDWLDRLPAGGITRLTADGAWWREFAFTP